MRSRIDRERLTPGRLGLRAEVSAAFRGTGSDSSVDTRKLTEHDVSARMLPPNVLMDLAPVIEAEGVVA